MLPQSITVQDIKNVLSKAPNWKAPGSDSLHNYWLKRFTVLHPKLAKLFSDVLREPQQLPEFLMRGTTYLLPKSEIPEADPAKYRPITCLPTLYKLLSGVLADKIYQHMASNGILAEEQKGCRRLAQGCKEQLLLDTITTEDAKHCKRSLYTAYVDYKKAFDSVPHSWLIDCLSLYKIDTQIIELLKAMMSKWTTNLITKREGPNADTININIKRGIFQGDALSALWFCIALNPLSTALNATGEGYKLTINQQKLSHLAYMDDIKLFSETKVGLKRLLRITEQYSNDIRMEFGLDKCKTNSIVKGKWQLNDEFQLLQRSGGGVIQPMSRNENYKYLGFLQSQGIDKKTMKKQLIDKMKKRVKTVMKTNLSSRNKITATNTFAVPVVANSFGIIKWTMTELDEINRMLRVTYTKFRAHHPRASKERFHLPRHMAGRGVTDLRLLHQKQIKSLRQYFLRTTHDSPFIASFVQADADYTPLHLNRPNIENDPDYSIQNRLDNWRSKELHGRYPHMLSQQGINKTASLGWLLQGNIFPETEGFLCAIQDQVIPTKSFLKHVVGDNNVVSTSCRMCGKGHENIEHIIAGCSVLAPKDYTNRHNNVAKVVHRELCINYGLQETRLPYYKYLPESVLENDRVKIYWDRMLLTDHPVPHNKPDIFIHDKTTNTITIIDIAVPAPANVITKQQEKIQKYLPLSEELKRVWQVEATKIIPIIIGATGEVPLKMLEGLKILGIDEKFYLEMQKAAILATCNTMRRVLNIT